MSMARSTPAQNDRGPASSTRARPGQRGPALERRAGRRAACAAPGRPPVTVARRATGSWRCRRRPARPRPVRPDCRAAPARSRPTPCRRPARPSRRAGARSAPLTMWSRLDASARCARAGRPAQLGRQRRGRRAGPYGPCASRTSLATTTSPGSQLGSSPPAKPATTTGVRRQRRQRAAAMPRTRCGPMPQRASSPRRPSVPAAARACSERSGAPRPAGGSSHRTATVRPDDEPAERAEREDMPVHLVVDVEVAGEAGAGVLRSSSHPPSGRWLRDQPGARRAPTALRRSPAASSASSAHAVCDGVDAPAPAPARVAVRAQVLAPAAVGVLVARRARRRPGGSAVVLGGDAGRDQRRHHRPGAVDVVGAPATEPGSVGLLVRRSSHRTPRRGAVGCRPVRAPASISTTWAVTSADGGSITAPKSQNGSFVDELAGVVGVERAPAAVARTACRAIHATPGRTAACTPRGSAGRDPVKREHDLGRVVDVGVVVVGELERPPPRLEGGRAPTSHQ